MSEWLKEADCKSVALRYVGSNPTRPNGTIKFLNYENSIYNPTIFLRIKYNNVINVKIDRINRIRNLGTFNKFLKGAKITRIKPIKLLIKKRG